MCQLKMITPKVIMALPQLGIKLNQLLPEPLKIGLITQVLQRLFEHDSQSGELDFLAGKKVVIEVTDFGFLFMLQLIDKSIRVSSCSKTDIAEPDLRVKANSVDFFLLCSTQVDPDTLFFQRRLSMIGDTELGLYLKNFLDSFDTKARLPKALWRTQQFIAMQLLFEPKQ